jgi:hypothetical protein
MTTDNPTVVPPADVPADLTNLAPSLTENHTIPAVKESTLSASGSLLEAELNVGDIIVTEIEDTEFDIEIQESCFIYVILDIRHDGVTYYNPLQKNTVRLSKPSAMECITAGHGNRTLYKEAALS